MPGITPIGRASLPARAIARSSSRTPALGTAAAAATWALLLRENRRRAAVLHRWAQELPITRASALDPLADVSTLRHACSALEDTIATVIELLDELAGHHLAVAVDVVDTDGICRG